MRDIRPDVHILESLRAARIDYPVLVGEGIDNAFDADAKMVAIVIDDKLISLQDDGVGITKDRILGIVRLGEHGPMTSTALGRYGVGIKHHAVNAGDFLEVRSTSADGVVVLRVRWSELIRSRDWLIDDPIWTPAFPGSHTGSQIVIRELRHRAATPAIIDKVRDQLAQRFYPAIAGGRIVMLNGIPIPLLEEPRLTDVIEATLNFPEGRCAHVRGGLLIDRSSRLRQVQVSYMHRVIMPMSDFGCGAYTGTSSMFARVDLTGPWQFEKFKNALVDHPYDEQLSEAVCEVLEPILEHCHNENISADIDELARQLNEMLPPELIPARPIRRKRGPRVVRPEDEQTASEEHGENDDGKETPSGPARAKRSPRDQLIIEFAHQSNDDYGYGTVSFGKTKRDPTRVKLTRENPHIVELRNARDRSSTLRSLFQIALMLYEHAREVEPDQRELQFDGPFGLRVWKMVERQRTDSQSAVA